VAEKFAGVARIRPTNLGLDEYVGWFDADRPHTFIAGATPDEIYFGRMPACRRPRLESRPRGRDDRRAARPHALVRG